MSRSVFDNGMIMAPRARRLASMKTVCDVNIKPQIVEDKLGRADWDPGFGPARSLAGKPILTHHIDMPRQIGTVHPLLTSKQHVIAIGCQTGSGLGRQKANRKPEGRHQSVEYPSAWHNPLS